MNATGTYVRTVFRDVWESGGVFHADEFDNGHPSTLATLNAALATSQGGSIAFPDGMISRHDDFRFVASANTFGRGPDRVYVGRQQLDAATLDRFVVEEIHVDESLEHAACLATGYDSPKVSEVLRYVRQLRHNAERQKSLLVFSPRASIGMCRLLQAGKPLQATISARVRKGISDSDWSKVSDGISNPSV
jgi:cobaltochelatase CobS